MCDLGLPEHSGAMDETTMHMTPPPPPVAPRLLRRSSHDRVFGGVCGGLGRYWNIDPVILRVVFGVSLLVGGIGLFLYLAMWWLVPDDSAAANARVNPSWWMVGLGVVAATIAGLIGLGLLFGDGGNGVLGGALIAGLVVWIVLSQRSPERTVQSPPPEPGYAYGGAAQYPPTTVLPQPVPPPAPARERSYLGLIGLCAALASTGLAMLLSDNPVVVIAAGLLALGVTLLVGAFRGRARWLLLFAVPWLLLLATVGQIQQLDLSAGAVQWRPTATDNTYNLTAGRLGVDFSDWQGQPEPTDVVQVEVGVGEVAIAAPSNWDLILVTDFGAPGSIDVSGTKGFSKTVDDKARTVVPASSGDADATVRMDISVQVGAVLVETGAPAVGSSPAEKPTKQATDKKEKAA